MDYITSDIFEILAYKIPCIHTGDIVVPAISRIRTCHTCSDELWYILISTILATIKLPLLWHGWSWPLQIELLFTLWVFGLGLKFESLHNHECNKNVVIYLIGKFYINRSYYMKVTYSISCTYKWNISNKYFRREISSINKSSFFSVRFQSRTIPVG